MADRRKERTGRGYLICFRAADDINRPALYAHAGHYLGFTVRDVAERFEDHVKGQASPLTKAASESGLQLVVARTWDNITREDERRLKANRGRHCPVCANLQKLLTGSRRGGIGLMHKLLDDKLRRDHNRRAS